MSTLQANDLIGDSYGTNFVIDPWNREIKFKGNFIPTIGRENEITEWTGFTSVEGFKIKLTIFND